MASPVVCARCGRDNDPSFGFCLDCGASLRAGGPLTPSPTELVCPGCGARVLAGFRFCGHCGHPMAPPAAQGARITGRDDAPEGQVVPAPRAAAVEPGAAAGAAPLGLRLVAVRPDGLPGLSCALSREGLSCGRTAGQLRFPDDATVAPQHARFTLREDGPWVEDLASPNGTFLRLRQPRPLKDGEEVRLGRQVLRIEPIAHPPVAEGTVRPWGSPDPGYRARLVQLLEGGGTGEVFPLRLGANAVGREVGDICFPSDRYVSARHARVDATVDGLVITDLGSSNGTFARTSGATRIAPGDHILIGMQLLRVEA